MGTILLIILILLLLGAFPRWGYNQNWGYGPSGGLERFTIASHTDNDHGTNRKRPQQ